MDEKVFIVLLNIGILFLVLFMQILIPYISRRNILLGVKVPLEALNTREVKGIKKGFIISNIFIGLISIGIISYFLYYYYSLSLMTLAPIVFLGILFIVYIIWNKKLKQIKTEMEWDKLATNVVVVNTKFSRDKVKANDLSKWWLLLPLVIVIVNIVLSLYKYPSLPERIPSHWDFQGRVDGYMKTTIVTVLMMPGFQLIMGLIMYFAYYSMKKSKQQIDSKDPEGSLKKNMIFRRIWGIFFLVATVLLEILFTILNMMILGMMDNMRLFNIVNTIVLGLIAGGSIILSLLLGQGGDRIKIHQGDTSPGFDMDDDKLWKLGNSIYYNPEDPAIFIEKRIGVGWTVNGGRPLGMLLLTLPFIITFIILLLIK